MKRERLIQNRSAIEALQHHALANPKATANGRLGASHMIDIREHGIRLALTANK